MVAVLQAKVLWGIFRFRDLTTGDTSAYFVSAFAWSEQLSVNIVWSPLYTAFYGTVFALTDDASLATTLHRVVIVMAATLGVLAVMRMLLPGAIALAIASWWAILPINFNTLYEVHLFALLPILAAWLVGAGDASAPRRGAVLGVLVATAALVRNELFLAATLFAASSLGWEVIEARRRSGDPPALSRRMASYLVPVLVAVLICAAFYARSTVKWPTIRNVARAKHTVNMCQVFAFGHAQRNPSWTLSPWTECYGLAEATFGSRTPSFREMLAANPRAVLDHVTWNLSLVPAGLQLALFDRTAGVTNPDYAPVRHSGSALAGLLTLVAGLLIGAAAVVVVRQPAMWHDWLVTRATMVTAMLCVALVSVPVIMTQRPRPSYLFSLTVVLMAGVGISLHVLTHRWPTWRDRVSLALWCSTLALVPAYFSAQPGDRPLHAAYRALSPLQASIRGAAGGIVLGDYAGELQNYLHLVGRSADDYRVLEERSAGEEVARFFDRRRIAVFFIQPRISLEFRKLPGAADLLDNPAAFGWAAHSVAGPGRSTWVLLYRRT
jgi:hypothetical protein